MANQDTLVTPPIRQSVEDANSAAGNGIAQPMTEKSWYLFWDRLGQMANRQNWMVNVGTHADRPPAGNMPNGAIYVEFDRGVIYQNWSGAWQYLAGTMYGTLAPDQRPTDLGSHDAGFDYRTTDQPPREFIWSGTAWVEVTAVTVGTHAGRPAPASEAEGNLYVEYDRGGVIYQNWAGGWQYLAGTMWGTLVPDQRPTDLGTRDAGFDFRTNTAPPREFIWSGTAWVETTSISGSVNLTHPNVVTKVGSTAGGIVEGGITDESAANANILHITSAGNVGIGVGSTVAYPLHVVRSESSASLAGIQQVAIGTVPSLPTFSLVLGYGNPGIGANVGAIQALAGGGGTSLLLNPSGGSVGIGYSTPGYLLQLGSDSAGKPGTSTWSVVSDIRVKQNIEPVRDDSLAILGALDWMRYEYNGQADTPQGFKAIGLSAQEVRSHLPEAVRSVKAKLTGSDAEESELLAIDYHHILVHSARAIQQLDAEVKTLRAMVEKLAS